MTHISCDTHTEEAGETLRKFLPRVSGVITPATELSVTLDTGMPLKIL